MSANKPLPVKSSARAIALATPIGLVIPRGRSMQLAPTDVADIIINRWCVAMRSALRVPRYQTAIRAACARRCLCAFASNEPVIDVAYGFAHVVHHRLQVLRYL